MLNSEMRRQIVDGMVQSGVPRSDAEIGIDLAVHAAQQACEALVRVSETAGTKGQQFMALQVAPQLLTHRFAGMLADLRTTAQRMGMTAFDHMIVATPSSTAKDR